MEFCMTVVSEIKYSKFPVHSGALNFSCINRFESGTVLIGVSNNVIETSEDSDDSEYWSDNDNCASDIAAVGAVSL